ncbi:hypothetical protein Sste5344_005033 [Sporothrix stenoceras]
MSSLFGPAPARLPSPASLLLEAWTSSAETKKLVDALLSRDGLDNNDTRDAPLLSDARENQRDALRARFAAFDRDMSVLSTVVTAIKALKKTSTHLSVLTSSPGSMQELKVPKRDSVCEEKYHLLTTVFFVEEGEVAWDKHDLVNGIDTITGIECRRRQDLGSIAEKLGIRSPGQLAIARRRMDPSLDILELLIAQNTQAEYLFRTVFLGTRICTICHHLNENTNIEFVVQLLNALFPPYLAIYPVPCIDVQEVRAVREKIYLALMDTDIQFEGDDGGIEAAALQNDLLTQLGIDSWRTEIYPALNEYFARVESVKKAYDELHNTQDVYLDCVSGDPFMEEVAHQAAMEIPAVKVRGPDERPDSTASSQHGPIKSILKNSFSSMSAQSVSTYASSYGSGSELILHPLAREMNGLDENELLRMGLALPSRSSRSNPTSFDSSVASPRALANLRAQLNLADELRKASSTPGTKSVSPSIISEYAVRPTPTAVNEDDDVFATAAEKKEKDKAFGLGLQNQETEAIDQQDDDHQETTGFPSLPALKVTKSAVILRGERPATAQATTPSERTLKLIKSSWKSTESLFTKFKAHEQDRAGVPVIPDLPTGDPRPISQRRPSKSVRFSDERTRDAVNRIVSGSSRTPSLMRTASGESSISVRTTASGAPSSIGGLDSILLDGMSGLTQVEVGA